jgi:Pentapeptide repeats (8 copies)
VQFDGANLSGVNLKQARLHGVNFGHATLTGAQFDGAWLTPDGNGGQASFANANLQGATFTDAKLQDAILTDAAVAVLRAEGSTDVDGVWLFDEDEPGPLLDQLAAGIKQATLDPRFAGQLVQGLMPDAVRTALGKQGVTLGTDALITVQSTGPLWTIADGGTTYRLFHACDTDQYTPALGVSKQALLVPAFKIPLYLASSLKSGPVPDSVRTAFQAKNVTLGDRATVTAGSMNIDWQFVDSNSSYDAWLGLNLDCQLTITVRRAIPGVLDLFATHSLPLTRRATISAAPSGRWLVDNDSNNPFNPIVNYIKCIVSNDPTADTLDVYGNMLRVLRVGPDGSQTFTNIQVKATGLAQKDLQPSTVCPNSARTKVNVSDKRPFKRWMRARELPKPPFCVPSADGAFYCPPSGPGRDPR